MLPKRGFRHAHIQGNPVGAIISHLSVMRGTATISTSKVGAKFFAPPISLRLSFVLDGYFFRLAICPQSADAIAQ